eukprot:6209202-Pleurochrysis_carterae.AAC.2
MRQLARALQKYPTGGQRLGREEGRKSRFPNREGEAFARIDTLAQQKIVVESQRAFVRNAKSCC